MFIKKYQCFIVKMSLNKNHGYEQNDEILINHKAGKAEAVANRTVTLIGIRKYASIMRASL